MDRRTFLESLAVLGIAPKIEVQSKMSTATLFAHWYCDLNTWKWPKEWGTPPERFRHKLEDLHGWERYEYCKDEYHAIADMVESIAGKKAVSKFWNCDYISNPMSAREFEEYWKHTQPGEEGA